MPVDGIWPVALVPLIAGLALATRAVNVRGAIAGIAVGFAITFGIGWRGCFMLGVFLVVGTLASRVSSRNRGPVQILCNGAVAGAAALAAGWGIEWGWMAAAGALSTGLSDTVAGELGRRFDARPRLLLFGPRVVAGRDGAMSWAGTLIGVVGAAAVALVGSPDDGNRMVLVALAGVAGNLADSVLGATIERRLGRHGNDIVSLLATGAGAAVAVALV